MTRLKKWRPARCLTYMLIAALLLTGCGKEPIPAPEPHATAASEPSAGTQPPATENPTVEVSFSLVDMSAFERSGLTLQQVFACDGQTMLFFTSPVNGDGTISEATVAYSYSIGEKRFRTASALLGTVALFPRQVLDDGTVVLVLQDSENYTYTGIVYLNPVTLEMEEVSLPPFDFYQVDISPNKQYAAFSTFDGFVVTDMTYDTEYFRLESWPLYENESDAQPVETVVPAAVAWRSDSGALTWQQTSWWDSFASGIVYADSWESRTLDTMVEKTMTFLDENRLFYVDCYQYLPAGMYRLDTGEYTDTPFAFESEPGIDVCAIAVSPSGGLVCVSYITTDDGGAFSYTASICDPATGKEIDRLTIESGTSFGCFEQVFFTLDESEVYLVSSASLNRPREVYVFPIGK